MPTNAESLHALETQYNEMQQNYSLIVSALNELNTLDYSLRGCCNPGLGEAARTIIHNALNNIKY